ALCRVGLVRVVCVCECVCEKCVWLRNRVVYRKEKSTPWSEVVLKLRTSHSHTHIRSLSLSLSLSSNHSHTQGGLLFQCSFPHSLSCYLSLSLTLSFPHSLSLSHYLS